MSRTLATIHFKGAGHEKIDYLVSLGVPREKVYAKLARKMRIPEWQAHFSKTNDDTSLWLRNEVLDKMIEDREYALSMREMDSIKDLSKGRIKKLEFKRAAERDYKTMFTDKSVLRRVGRRNRIRIKWLKSLFISMGVI